MHWSTTRSAASRHFAPPVLMAMSFRVVTYNIHKGIGGVDRRYQLDRIVETLSHLEADIVCLQEVDDGVPRSHHDQQAKMLSEALPCRTWRFNAM